MNAIQVLLSDGKQKTVVTTPETTCGEILRKILNEIDKESEETSYSLHLQYALSGIRIAMDSEKIKDLVSSYNDPLEKVYLRPSFEVMYYNTTKSTHSSKTLMTSSFSPSWIMGSDTKQDSIDSSNDGTYCNVKKKRRPRLSVSRGSSHFNSFIEDASPYYENVEIAFEKEKKQESLQHLRVKGIAKAASKRQSSEIFEDVDAWLGDKTQSSASSNTLLKQHHYSIETKCISTDSLKRTRDSGIAAIQPLQDEYFEDDYIEMQPVTTIEDTLLANDNYFNVNQQNLNVSKLSSSKSLEALSADCIEEISAFSLSNNDDKQQEQHIISPQHDYDYPLGNNSSVDPPEIPKRHSSLYITSDDQISNEVLIQQGKRLSAIFNFKEAPQIKPTFGTSVKSVINKMRKVSLPAVNYIKPTKSPKPAKRKVSVQTISEPVLRKHPSMEEIVSKTSLQLSSRLSIPSSGNLEGKRSHSFTHLNNATDAFQENEEYEVMLPTAATQWKSPVQPQNNSYNDKSVRSISPMPSPIYDNASPLYDNAPLYDNISIQTKTNYDMIHDVKSEQIPWTSKKIRKNATVSTPLRSPIPPSFMKPQIPKPTTIDKTSTPDHVMPRWGTLPSFSSQKMSEKDKVRKGSHPVYSNCLVDSSVRKVKESKSVHDLISFFNA